MNIDRDSLKRKPRRQHKNPKSAEAYAKLRKERNLARGKQFFVNGEWVREAKENE